MRYPGLLRRGSTGSSVRRLQRRLRELGYRILGPRGKELTVDGVFGPVTEEAVCQFQMQGADRQGNPLVVDGKVGPFTWEALFGEHEALALAKPGKAGGSLFMASTLEIALSQVGVREIPKDSNRGAEVEQYLSSVGLEPGHAWCAAFAYWCAREAATRADREEVPLVRTGWTPSIWNWARKRKSFLLPDDVVERKKKPAPGCLFLLHGRVNGRARVNHVGFVAGLQGGLVRTVEGNTNKGGGREGGGVYELNRKISTIYRFVTYG